MLPMTYPHDMLKGIRETYDGPLSMADGMMVWNITRDEITERMAVSPDDAWDVPGPAEERLRPDPSRKSEYTQFILSGSLDVGDVNQEWLQKFMQEQGLTPAELGRQPRASTNVVKYRQHAPTPGCFRPH